MYSYLYAGLSSFSSFTPYLRYSIQPPPYSQFHRNQFQSEYPHINHFIGKEYVVNTGTGKVSVTVYGDPEKPGLITYPDLGVNYVTCFQGLFSCPEAASLLFDNFCVYHIHPPGHQLSSTCFDIRVFAGRSPAISREEPVLTVGALADQILEAWSSNVHGTNRRCLYPNAAMKYRDLVLGLILISPLCKSTSWPEWFYNKLTSHILHYSEISKMVKDILLKRYFSKEARGNAEVPELGVVQACRRLLSEKHACDVWRRHDLTRGLKSLTCPTLIFVGDHSPFISDARHMSLKLGKKQCTLVEVQACGSMQVPLENFLMRYGMYRPSLFNDSPRSVLNQCCISPDLLSPQSMGLKLKPIRTRSL